MSERIQWGIGFLAGALLFTTVLIIPSVSFPVFPRVEGMAVAAVAYLLTQTRYRMVGYGVFFGLAPAILIALLA